MSSPPAVLAGHAGRSALIRHVSDQVEDPEMPPLRRRSQFPALGPAEIARLRDWINRAAR